MFEAAARDSPDGTVECAWEVFRDLFIPDAPPEAARSMWERLVPQPFAPWAEKLELSRFYRGEIPRSYVAVADDALCDALDSGHVRGAALDVFAVEPLPPDSLLRGRPNVLLSPHLAGSTNEARRG